MHKLLFAAIMMFVFLALAGPLPAGAAWQPPELIDAGAGNNAVNPQIAFDSAGNAIAIWSQHDGSNNRIYAALYSSPPFSGGDGTAGDPWQIATAEELDNVRNYLGSAHADKHFVLIADINLTGFGGAEGWEPIGTYADRFTGTFDGQEHVIENLFIDRSGTDAVGLFGWFDSGGEVKNVGLENVDVTGHGAVGGLIGFCVVDGTVSNSYSTGEVSGNGGYVGGLIGANQGAVSNSYSTSKVSGSNYVGGLVGVDQGTVSNSHSTGRVTGDTGVGGLAGLSYGPVTNSYSTGPVTGDRGVGGLVGVSDWTVSNSYSTGEVSGNGFVGGLIGATSGTVSNSYSTGSVTRTSGTEENLGGFVGRSVDATIEYSYSTGSVYYDNAADPTDKGFVGEEEGTNNICASNFFDNGASNQNTDAVGAAEPKTTSEMKDFATFDDWNIVGDPTIAVNYPFLVWQGQESYAGDPVWVIGTQDLVFSDRFELSDSGGPLTSAETEVDVTGSAM
jgi:hypothetical protein